MVFEIRPEALGPRRGSTCQDADQLHASVPCAERYISPEQLASRAIDGRSDLFSLGVMMFEMLTGKLPFSGDTAMAMALARQLYDAPLLSTLRPDLPSEITQLVARCLCRLPEERFATAGQCFCLTRMVGPRSVAMSDERFDGEHGLFAKSEPLRNKEDRRVSSRRKAYPSAT